MLRRVLRVILLIVTFTLPVAAAVCWFFTARQAWYTDWDPFAGPTVQYQLQGLPDALILWRHERGAQVRPTIQRSFAGFTRTRSAWGNTTQGQLGASLGFEFRYPSLLVVSSLPLAAWTVVRLLRRRKATPGHCINCGYDLRATPERCPECGTIAKPRL